MSRENLREKLEQIELKARAKAIDPDNTPKLLIQIPEFNLLQREVETFWMDALDNLPVIAPDPIKRSILISTLSGLSPESYLRAINHGLDLYDRKQLDTWDIRQVTTPFGKLAGLLTDNYQEPRVRAILIRLRAALSTDPNIARGIDSVLSGEAKRGLDEQRAAFSKMPNEVPPVIMLEKTESTMPQRKEEDHNLNLDASLPKRGETESGGFDHGLVSTVKSKMNGWPWVVSAAALIVIVALVLKRRV